MTDFYVGLMSGTSQDGVDAVLAEFDGAHFRRIANARTVRYPASLRARLLRLASDEHPVTVRQLVELDQAVARAFARAAIAVAKGEARIEAIGSHGQTVFHSPEGPLRSSLQLGDPNLIAALTGIATIGDFRRADMAVGGQGAPLVPAFHHAVFASAYEARAIVNIGGIANITILPDGEAGTVRGFDTGPGNALLDEWTQRHRRRQYDRDGRWGAAGTINQPLLRALLREPFFRKKPPKSTGRGDFNLRWLQRRYPAVGRLDQADVQSTLTELTACSIARAIERHAAVTARVLVCGGGVRNAFLMRRLQAHLAPRTVESTASQGLDPQRVEAAAFAWLAMRTANGLPGNLPAVTGALKPVVLGGIFEP